MTRSAPDTRTEPPTPLDVRYNAGETAPQRRPRFPDTAWGQLRAERGWSLRELGRRSGLNIADLSRIERGLQGATPEQARGILGAIDGPALRFAGYRPGLFLVRLDEDRETVRIRRIEDPAANAAERRRTIGGLVDILDDQDGA